MHKIVARKQFLDQRLALDRDTSELWSKQITERLIKHFSDIESSHVFLPIAKFNEVHTWSFIDYLHSQNKRVYTSYFDGDVLKHCVLAPETQIGLGKWDIPQPQNPLAIDIQHMIDLCIVPLLAVDHEGNRVGYGKGFYDAIFQDIPTAIKVGVSFFEPIERIEGLRPEDVPLDYVITPQGCIRF